MVIDPPTVTDFVRHARAQASESVGIWVESPRDRPHHLADDYRGGEISAIAIHAGRDLDLVLRSPSAGSLVELAAWLTGPDEPYLAFHDSHDAIHRWSVTQRQPFEPPRTGCLRIAAALLGEGTRPYRDLPPFEELVTRFTAQTLPADPLLSNRSPQRLIASARAALETLRALTPRLRARDLVASYQLECRLVPVVVAMERAGVGVDAAGFERVVASWRRERAEATTPERITRLDKLLSTYGYWPREYVRGGRIHARLHPMATESGRFSCTDPNLQQVPSEHTAPGLRACFRPPQGYGLVIADYAQIELRVAAHLAPCEAMRGVFLDARDPHRATAATLTTKPETEITAHERKLAKAVNFGFLFGMGAARFRSYALAHYGLELDLADARRAKDAFFATFPGIARWHRRVGALKDHAGPIIVRTALGRRKRFPPGAFSFNAALNIPVQGTAAEGFKKALIALHPRLRTVDAHGVLCVHDEYLVEAPLGRGHEARDLVETTMREAMASLVSTVPIVVDAHLVQTWAEKT